MEPAEYALEAGARLRAVRMALGWSLRDAELRSRSGLKAVVIGSYERGDRSVTIERLAEVADLYQVPVSSLLPPDTPRGAQTVRLAEAILEAGLTAHEGKHVARVMREMLAAGLDRDAVLAS